MHATCEGFDRQPCELVMSGRDDHDIGSKRDQLRQVVADLASEIVGKPDGGCPRHVRARDEPVDRAQRFGALATDQAAADDSD
jgi:hypothetical protein